MSVKRIRFASEAMALLFLKRISPRSVQDSWRNLQDLSLLPSERGPDTALDISQEVFARTEVQSALERCEGAVVLGHDGTTWEEGIPCHRLFQVGRLERTNLTGQAPGYLVVPILSDMKATRGLVSALSNLPDWGVLLRTFVEDGKEDLCYELQSITGQSHFPPSGLPGAPFVLVQVAENVFVPPGYKHSLLPDYRFLLPPVVRGSLHTWLPIPGDEPKYHLLQEADRAAERLARLTFIDTSASEPASICKGSVGRIQVPLEFRRTHGRRPIKLAAQRVYRVVSRASEFGPLLLRMLDHAEAGIETFTYYSLSLGKGPNALVEHYLLTEAQLGDDDAWPDLERFDCLQGLHDLGLPLFFPSDLELVPNIDGLLKNADSNDPLLQKLRELAQLPATRSDRVALVLPDSEDRKWKIRHLEEGCPLVDVITPVMQNYNREEIRRAADIQRIDIAADRKEYEEKWIAAGDNEAREMAAAAEALTQEFIASAQNLDGELVSLAERLQEARRITEPAEGLLCRELPRTIEDFARRMGAIMAALAAPQHAWLQGVHDRQRLLTEMQGNAQTLLQDAAERVGQLEQAVQKGNSSLSEVGQRLSTEMQRLQAASEQLEALVREANTSAGAAQTAIQARRERLQSALAEAKNRELSLTQESSELDRFQEQVEAEETRVQEWQNRLATRRRDLNRRLAITRENIRLAEEEEQRLHHMESVEIPAADKRLKTATAAVKALQSKGIESLYADLSARLETTAEQLRALRQAEAELEKLERRFDSLTEDIRKVQARISDLESRSLEQAISEAEGELGALENTAASAETAFRLATQAAVAIKRAKQLIQTVFSSSGNTEIESRISSLEGEVQKVLEQAEQCRPENRSAKIEARLLDLEREIGKAREVAGLRRPWWKIF